MTKTLEIDIGEPYKKMLEELEKKSDGDPRNDLRRLVEQGIHDGYQQVVE